MEPHISEIFSFSESAKDLWKSVASLYGLRNNAARVFELKREIAEAEQGTKSFTEHFGYLKKKWDELDTYRPHTTDAKSLLKRVEEDKIFDVLSSLKPEYESLRSIILMSAELPNLDTAESSALMSYKDDKRRAVPFDKDKNSRAKANFDKNKLARAAVADNSSFTIDQLKDFFNQLGNKTERKATHASVHAFIRSSHKDFSVANGSTAPVMGSGKVNFFPDCPPSNALVVPSVPTQLLSVGQITNSLNCDVTFTPTSVIFQDRKTKKKIGRDDWSRATWIYLLKSKTEVSSVFADFHCMIRNQFDAQVTIFRSDNGTEFVKGLFPGYLRSHGIIHQTSCVGTSQQNGVAERKLRHILETTRALMIQMHAKHRDKLDSRATKCVFFGYSSTKKGYICYHPPTRKLQISRDVVFDVTVAYFQCDSGSRSQGECYTDLEPLPVINEIHTATDSHRDNGGGVELVDLPNAVLDVHKEAVHEEASDNNVSVTHDDT
ncbi:uncharacterized protein LOC113345900 [Papaver somniferum]|uniref:uncharacterized protein LOC113345900 n=1 Tax=Papaver somniferum TaxID=3469 RepID=UPI000E700701|nr:uncharacterized protein LOC113345900 [Papaver somniferum]